MTMKPKLLLWAMLLSALTAAGAAERPNLKEILTLKSDGQPSRLSTGIELRQIPKGVQYVTPKKRQSAPSMRVTPTGAELLGWLNYSMNTETARGLYEYEANEFKLKWADPMWTDPERKATLMTSWVKDNKICGYIYQILWGYLNYNEYAEYDLETGEMLSVSEVPTEINNKPAVMQTVAYDKSDNILYGYGQMDGGYAFMTANPDEPSQYTLIRSVENSEICASLCYNQYEDALYGINLQQELVTIDPLGNQKIVFKLPVENVGSYVTGLAYNPDEQVYYWNMINKEGASSLVRVNPAEQTAEVFDTFESGETFCTLFCLDDKMRSGMPRRPKAVSIDFKDGSTTGYVNYSLPQETVTGTSIVGNLTYTAWLDGDKYSEGTAAAGTELAVEYSGLSDAMHTFGLSVAYDGVSSAIAPITGYIGNDIPLAPQGVTMAGKTVSWDPVTQGIHGKYIDVNAMRYEVFINGESAGQTQETSMDVTLPEDKPLEYYTATVKAICNGMESKMSGESNGIVTGKPMEIPVYLTPTPDEFRLMTSYDPNGGGWYIVDIEGGYVVCPVSSDQQQDNWLFLPPFSINDASRLYTFSFDALTWGEGYTEEYADVFLCSSPTPEGVISAVIKDINPNETPVKYSGLIEAPAPGTYYIAIHCTSAPWQLGVLGRNFRITDDNVLLTSPDEALNLTAAAAPEGKLEATISFDMPSKSIGGNPLPENDELTATIVSKAGSAEVKGKPGQSVSATVTTEQGDNVIEVTVANNVSKGRTTTINVYTGVTVPENVSSATYTTSQDMMGVQINWQAPKSGLSGGYIDSEKVVYDIYRYELNYIGWYWQVYAQDIKETSFTYTAEPETPQSLVQLGIASRNEAGSTGEIVLVTALLGMPYELPMNENFEYPEALLFQPWLPYAPSAEYDDQSWSFDYLNNYDATYPTNPIGLIGTSWSPDSYGMVGFPRFSTKGSAGVTVALTVLNGPDMPELAITARGYDSEAMEFGKIQPASEKNMTTYKFQLPAEMLNRDWVQVYLTAKFAKPGQFVFVDNVDIKAGVSGVDNASADKNIIGDNGNIRFIGLDGCTAQISSLDGRIVYQGIINGDDTSIQVEHGIYLVKADSIIAKTLVK